MNQILPAFSFKGEPLTAAQLQAYFKTTERARWHVLEGNDSFALERLERFFWKNYASAVPFRRFITLETTADWEEIYGDLQRLTLFDQQKELLIFRFHLPFSKSLQLSLKTLSEHLMASEKEACFMICSARPTDPDLQQWLTSFLNQSLIRLVAQSVESLFSDEGIALGASGAPEKRSKTAQTPELSLILQWLKKTQSIHSLEAAFSDAKILAHAPNMPQMLIIRVVQKHLARTLEHRPMKALNPLQQSVDKLLDWEIGIRFTRLESSPLELESTLMQLTFFLSQL